MAGLVGLVLGCSTLADPDQQTGCQSDDECAGGEICAVDTGQCVNGVAPPRGALGFAITEGEFTVELAACDAEVSRSGSELVLRPRADLANQLSLTAMERYQDPNCVCGPGYECNPDLGLCEDELSTSLELRQRSRLGRGFIQSLSLVYPIVVDEIPQPEEPVLREWAHYATGNADADFPVVIEVVPDDSVFARLYRAVLTEDQEATTYPLEVELRRECIRRIDGSVRRWGPGSAIAGAGIRLRHNEPVAAESSVLPASARTSCSGDEECGPGLACNPDTGSCGLDLGGVISASTTSDENGSFSVRVYNYCETGSVSQLDFAVTAAPGDEADSPATGAGLPRLNYDIQQSFSASQLGGPGDDPLSGGDLCLPDWSAPQSFSFPLEAEPITLAEGKDDAQWICCDTSCLPAGLPIGEAAPPVIPEGCTNDNGVAATVRFEAFIDEPDNWDEDPDCAPLLVNDDGHVGSYALSAQCEAGTCTVPLSHPAAGSASYRVSIEPGEGSVFRSRVVMLDVDGQTDSLEIETPLRPRVLVRGSVICDAGVSGCTAIGASVRAERLRDSADPDFVAGPYFYDQVTFAPASAGEEDTGGTFVLPVNPGIYVLTALPPQGSAGGPSRYRVLDLRLDGPLVAFEGGIPVVDLADPLVLEPGLPVRVELPDFSTSTKVLPLDTGSWNAQDGFGYDLNDPETCYHEDASVPRGCSIRLLKTQGQGLLQSRTTQFFTRPRGTTSCG